MVFFSYYNFGSPVVLVTTEKSLSLLSWLCPFPFEAATKNTAYHSRAITAAARPAAPMEISRPTCPAAPIEEVVGTEEDDVAVAGPVSVATSAKNLS